MTFDNRSSMKKK